MPDIGQEEQHIAAVVVREREPAFRQIPWSLTHVCIAVGMIAIFRVVFYGVSLIGTRETVYLAGVALWILMFGWMAVFPLWIARGKGMLRFVTVGRALKELGIAIPLVMLLILIDWLGALILSNMTEGAGEMESALTRLRDAPNDARLYLFLIYMVTFGPVAEEIFFRGFLYNAMRQRLAPVAAVVLQSLVFALVHYHWPERSVVNLLFVFVTGVILAVVYEWRKTLWSPISMHVLKNFAFAGPVIVLIALNHHRVARTWPEAEQPPEWLGTRLADSHRQPTGEEQRLYAINTWGSKGLRLWKKEVRALQAVCDWFPEDREACAQARLGIAQIYLYYLRDFRRAVDQSDRLLSQFKDRPENCAEALLVKGWSYRELGDRAASRESFLEVVESYASYERAKEEASEGLKMLDGG